MSKLPTMLTQAAIENLLDNNKLQCQMQNGKFQDMRRNGKTKTWKVKYPNRFDVPCKTGFRTTFTLTFNRPITDTLGEDGKYHLKYHDFILPDWVRIKE